MTAWEQVEIVLGFFNAIGTILLVLFALIGLKQWKNEINYSRNIERLEKALFSLYQLDLILKKVRSQLVASTEDYEYWGEFSPIVKPYLKDYQRILKRIDIHKDIILELINHKMQMEIINEKRCANLLDESLDIFYLIANTAHDLIRLANEKKKFQGSRFDTEINNERYLQKKNSLEQIINDCGDESDYIRQKIGTIINEFLAIVRKKQH